MPDYPLPRRGKKETPWDGGGGTKLWKFKVHLDSTKFAHLIYKVEITACKFPKRKLSWDAIFRLAWLLTLLLVSLSEKGSQFLGRALKLSASVEN